jgi:hypothetical protein
MHASFSTPLFLSFFSQWLLELLLFFFFAGIPNNNSPQLSLEVVSFLQIGKTTKHNEQIRKTLLETCHITFLPLQTRN